MQENIIKGVYFLNNTIQEIYKNKRIIRKNRMFTHS